MPYEMLVGICVTDATTYQAYRDAIKQLLEQHGGGFRFDATIAKVLSPESQSEINRVFQLYFESLEKKEAFFANPEYKVIRARYFDSAARRIAILAEYDRP